MKKLANWDMRIRQSSMSLLVLLLMTFAACSTETMNDLQPSEGRGLSFVATIVKGGDARTSYIEEEDEQNGRPYLKALWGGKEAMSETITLYTENGVSCGNWVANIPAGGSVTAEFSGNIEAGSIPAKAYYANSKPVSSLSQALDLTLQKQGASGSTVHLSNNDFMIGTVAMPTQGSAEPGSIHFEHLTSVLKYTLSFPTAGQQQSPLQVKSITLKQQEGEGEVLKLKQSFDGTSVSETFSLLNLTFTNEGGVVTDDGKLEAYVSLFPSSTLNKKFTLTAQTTAGIYQAVFTINRNLEANNLYTITSKMNHCEEYNWYMTPQKNEEGTEVYTIKDAEELAAFAKIVNGEAGMTPDSFEGKIVEMNNNISLEAYQPWIPIGKSMDTPFKGTFDGLNHTVSKLKTDKDKPYQGFFGVVENATIRNLTIEGEVEGTEYVGAVAAYATNSTFEDCTFGNSNLSMGFYVKGINWIGGVIGYAKGSVFEFCANYGYVEGGTNGYVGGLGGGCEGDSSLRGCSNYGNVAVGQDGCGGGLMGFMQGGYISGCANHGQMTSVASMFAKILSNIAGEMVNGVVITGSYSDGNNGNDVYGFGTGDFTFNGSYYTGGKDGEGYKEQLSQEDYDAMNELLYGEGLGFGSDGKPMVPTDFGGGNVNGFEGGGYLTVE